MCCARSTDEDPALVSTWTLCWQAAVGRDFLVDPSLHWRIRQRLIGAHERAGRVLIDYLVLPGEIHTVTQVPAGDSVGNVARAFGNVLSRWVREMQPVRSPVLAGPYRAQPLSSIDGLREEARMLGWRPVYLGLCSTPTHCPHGALRTVLGLTPANGFDARPLLRHFGSTVTEARASLRRSMRRPPSDEEWRAWELARGLQMAMGSVGPRPTMARAVHGPAAALVAAGRTYDVDGALALLTGWVAARIQTSAVPDLHGGSSAMDARGRALVACLAVDHRLCSASSVARYFRKAKATLSEQMAACRARAADRRILETPVRRILEETAALRAVGESKRHP
jgi:hypothetical protein